jgi:nucleotide-binding universal stress UspA family protein
MRDSANATITRVPEQPAKGVGPATRAKSGKFSGPVVVAAKGADETAATLSTAQQVAMRLGSEMLVMSVVPPLLASGLPPEMQSASAGVDQEAVEARGVEIDALASAQIVPGVRWSADVRLGQPAIEICQTAAERDAVLIVAGASPSLRRHQVVAGQRAAQILHRASTPVLSVAPWLRGLPANVLATIDFNSASLHAAQTAARLLRTNGSITLVHVLPPGLVYPGSQVVDDGLRGALMAELESVAANIRTLVPDSATVNAQLLTGDVTTEILSLADRTGADLITLGTRSQSVWRRAFVGSVATEVFHSALTSVLASPPPPVARQIELALATSGTAESTNAAEFADALNAFSKANAGKVASLEEDERTLGAQVQMDGLQFLGASFDAHDGGVQLMFGSSQSGRGHLTRSVPDVEAIAVARVSYAGGSALRVKHGAAETIVLIHPDR